MQQKFLIELNQELPTASFYELLELCNGSDCFFERGSNGFALVSGSIKNLSQGAFVRRISEVIASLSEVEEIRQVRVQDGTFCVRFQDSSGCHNSSIEAQIGEMLNGKGRIRFTNPDQVIRVYHWKMWYVCREIYFKDPKEFQKRRAPLRPFFSPVSIDPKYARFMVNISGTGNGETILDPFCGTGGILIEAHFIGRRIIGIDRSLQMVTGSKLNLKFLGIKDGKVVNSDFLSWKKDADVDAIVTDLPYGRSSPTFGDSIDKLYEDAFLAFSRILQRYRRCIVIISDPSLLRYSEKYFITLTVIGKRVHKSLTRYFCCLVRR